VARDERVLVRGEGDVSLIGGHLGVTVAGLREKFGEARGATRDIRRFSARRRATFAGSARRRDPDLGFIAVGMDKVVNRRRSSAYMIGGGPDGAARAPQAAVARWHRLARSH